MIKNDLSFEEALEGLEKSAKALVEEETTLDEAINYFENGMSYYQRCVFLLDKAKQKIQLYDKANDKLLDFE